MKCALLAVAWPLHVSAVLLAKRPGEMQDLEAVQPFGSEADAFRAPHVELINKTSVSVEALDECMCGLGSFWHSELQKCLPQQSKGLNCGGMGSPRLWPAVCQDGLICKIPMEFDSDGKSDDASILKQAMCMDCDPNDHCQWGMERHEAFCPKAFAVSGPACATVRVTVPHAHVRMSVEKTVTVKAVSTKSAHASAKDRAHAVVLETATVRQSNIEAEATESATANASATANSSDVAGWDLKSGQEPTSSNATGNASAQSEQAGESAGDASAGDAAAGDAGDGSDLGWDLRKSGEANATANSSAKSQAAENASEAVTTTTEAPNPYWSILQEHQDARQAAERGAPETETETGEVPATVKADATAKANATRSASAGATVTGEATAELTVPFTQSAIRSSTKSAIGEGLAQGSAVVSACMPPLPMTRTPDPKVAAQAAAQALEAAFRYAANTALGRALANAQETAKKQAIDHAAEVVTEKAKAKAVEVARAAAREIAEAMAQRKASELAEAAAQDRIGRRLHSLESQAALFDPAFIVPQEEAERLAKEKAREVAQKNAAKAAEESAKETATWRARRQAKRQVEDWLKLAQEEAEVKDAEDATLKAKDQRSFGRSLQPFERSQEAQAAAEWAATQRVQREAEEAAEEGAAMMTTLGIPEKHVVVILEGVLGLYRGLLPFSALEATEQKAMYVLNYAAIKSFLRRLFGQELGMFATVLCGYLSDLLCVPISMPIEALVVQLQTRKPEISKAEVVRQALFTWEGLAMALKSGKAYFVLSLKPGIEFALFDRIKSMILKGYSKKELRPLTAFFLGAVARAVATCMVYPYVRGKALSQAKLAPNATAALRKVFAEEGVAALYRGLSMDGGWLIGGCARDEIMRGMTQSAVMFAVMERIRLSVRAKLLRTNN
eukprot:g19904.t1